MNHKVCKWYPVCPLKFYYEQRKLDEKWVKIIVLQIGKGEKMANQEGGSR